MSINRLGRIYLLTNLVNNKVYVGQTVESLVTRWRKHRSNAKRGSLSRIGKAIRKYGPNAFTIQRLTPDNPQHELNNLEQVWIILFKSTNGDFGYNITAGGDHVAITPEGIEKMRKSLTGKKLSLEECQRRSERMRVRWSNPEYKKKMSTIFQNMKHPLPSEETREKMRAAKTGRKDSAETIEKKRQSALNREKGLKRRPISDETRQKMSLARLGHKDSPETLEKKRQARLNRGKK
jgi:group I intron endonuclease